jgi:hypothetical protein
MPRIRTRLIATAVACAALLFGAAVALAAHPKKGAHFNGSFNLVKFNGFKAPVAFAVSKNGKTLTGFTYSTLGCEGSGGGKPGVDYYTKPWAIIKVGTVNVSSSGHFTASGVISKYTAFGQTTETISTVSGSFSKSKSASGTITFTQKYLPGTQSCSSSPLAFSAKAK